jgi:NDP-sugar pyrophosphorylase family protein
MLPLAILAGGFATRLGSLTKDTPKCLIEVNGRPFVDWQLDLLIKNGFTDFVFCISYRSEKIQDYLEDGSSKGIQIQYSLDGDRQLGTGGAISNAVPLLGDKFGVVYGDSYLPINYCEVEDFFIDSNLLAVMTVFKNDGLFDSSNVEYSEGLLKEYQKENRNPRMRHIDYGLSYFNSNAFKTYPKGEFFDLSNMCSDLVKQKKISGFEVKQRFYEIGSVRGIEDFASYLERHSDEL